MYDPIIEVRIRQTALLEDARLRTLAHEASAAARGRQSSTADHRLKSRLLALFRVIEGRARGFEMRHARTHAA